MPPSLYGNSPRMSTHSADSRDHSPDEETEKRVSKKRKVLSCYACRSRKMKCDRLYPVCGRCQKTSRADQCTYDPRLLEDLATNGDNLAEGNPSPSCLKPDGQDRKHIPSDGLTWKLRAQERRLDHLERKLAEIDDPRSVSMKPSLFLPRGRQQADDEPKIEENMMFRGKGFKTQFHGSTSFYSLITQFQELQVFTQQAMLTDTSMAKVRTDFKAFRNRKKALEKEHGTQTKGTDSELFALVPEKRVMDVAISLYFQHYENAYRILHEPSFWKDYQMHWDRPAHEEGSPAFAATLLLIVALTKCLFKDQETAFVGDKSADREDAADLIEACDAWLLRHSRKHLTLAFFQLACMSLLAKRVNCIKLKQDWVNSGEVIRLAIAAGLHRDSALLVHGHISEFEKEMRRRLWSTIVELELQCSIDAGLQSSICSLHVDTQPPSNLPDDAIPVDCQQLPASRPRDHFTHSSYLACSTESLPLRAQLMQILNNPSADLQYSDILHYDQQITSVLANLPRWEDAQASVSRSLLDLQLRQFLVILHRPYAKLARRNPRFVYSSTACINAASTVISLHDRLLEKNLCFLNHLRNDIVRAIISLSQVVHFNSCIAPGTNASVSANATFQQAPQAEVASTAVSHDVPGPNLWKVSQHPVSSLQIHELPRDDFVTRQVFISSIELLDRAREILEKKVMRLGTCYMEYWLVLSALGILPSIPLASSSATMASSVGPSDIKSRQKRAVERMTSVCFRVLAMQKDPSNEFARSLRSHVEAGSVSGSTNNVSTAATSAENTPVNLDQMHTYLQTGASGLVGAFGDTSKYQGNMEIAPMGTWNNLQDMQVDFGGFDFPNFWSFDIGGDF